jgi:hypothetical protein
MTVSSYIETMIKVLEELTDNTVRTRIENGEAGRHVPLTMNLFSSPSSIIIMAVGIILLLISPGLVLLAILAYFPVFRKQRADTKRKENAYRLQIWNNVLNAVFPGARLNDDRSEVNMNMVSSVLPENEYRVLHDSCALHDELDTHIYQLYAYDEYRDENDNLKQETKFNGLVLHVHIPTGMSGDDILKVVRTNKVLGREIHRDRKMKGLKRFETEDIVFNENYDAYGDPSSAAARAVLGPAAIVQLDNWVKKHPVNMIADADDILIAFDLRGELNGLFSQVQVSYGGIIKSRHEYLEDNFYETLRSTLEEPMRVLSAVTEQIVKN